VGTEVHEPRPVMVRRSGACTEPAALLAVTVWIVSRCKVVGVPVIRPVSASRFKPPGRAGDTVKDATGPPLTLAGLAVIASSFTYSARGVP